MQTKNCMKCLNVWIHCLQKWIYEFRRLLKRKDEINKLETANFWLKNEELKNTLLNESSLQSFVPFTDEISSLNKQLDIFYKTTNKLHNEALKATFNSHVSELEQQILILENEKNWNWGRGKSLSI